MNNQEPIYKLAMELIRQLGLANGCKFKVTESQINQLMGEIQHCQNEGMIFDVETISEVTDGECEEIQEKFGKFPHWKSLDVLLNTIFIGV